MGQNNVTDGTLMCRKSSKCVQNTCVCLQREMIQQMLKFQVGKTSHYLDFFIENTLPWNPLF